MDAIILVGGQGTRLRPLTAARHKSLVPVCNRPMISYLFDWLERSGFERAVLALGQANEDLAEAFPPGPYGSMRIEHVIERQRLESGGAIRNAVQEAGIDERFLVLNGDIYINFDFDAAVRAHEEASAELTLALTPVEDPSGFGVAVVNDHGLVTGFVEKPPRGTAPGKLVNAGAWIFERALADEIPPGAVRVEETLFPSLVARNRNVLGYTFEGPWMDIGNPERYRELNVLLAPADGVCGPGSVLGSGVALSHSTIGARCTLERAANLSNSVLWDGVHVGANARVCDSVLADDVVVGAEALVEGVVAGRGAVIDEGARLQRGTILEGS